MMPKRSRPSSRIVRILALIPERLPRRSENRRPPNINSRTIRSDQRSPSNSRPSAEPQASSYQRFSSAGDLVIFSLVIFFNFIVAFYNLIGHAGQALELEPREAPMPKMIFVNLPVANVEKSAAFYEAIGFTKDARFSRPGAAAAMVWSDTIVFMILSHAHFADFTSKRIVDAKNDVQTLRYLSIDRGEGVVGIVEKAVAA